MAPVLTEFIIAAYEAINTAGSTIKAIMRGLELGLNALSCLDITGITASVNMCMTLLEKFATWVFDKICDGIKDSILIACLLRCIPILSVCFFREVFLGMFLLHAWKLELVTRWTAGGMLHTVC